MSEAVEILHLRDRGQVQSFAVDSRNVRRGEIFFALPGARVDGHHFLKEVAQKGAFGAVVAKSYAGPAHGLQLWRVSDPLDLLQRCAQLSFRRTNAQVVGITGSVGKTTTKEFATTLLADRYRVWATPGNRNSQIGLPLALLDLKGDEEILLLEMAMTERGQIARLVELFPPHIAVITAVALCHAEAFASLEEIAMAKAEIFSSPEVRLAIGAFELPECVWKEVHCARATFSLSPGSGDYRKEGTRWYERGVSQGSTAWPLQGKHHQHNFLAALAIARALGVSWKEILSHIPKLRPFPQRYCVHEIRGLQIVDDTYNAYEVSTCAALDSLPEPKKGGQRIAVLGEMVQLGRFSKRCHETVASHALNRVDRLLCVGEGAKMMYKIWQERGREVSWHKDAMEVASALKELAQPGDVVLLKGSRPLKLERVLELLQA